ncbi:hypothetical protein CALVIDRAFT_537375 [Calocera viscosa TUFC12733]|uniref:Uncharacterized protein n=1 Tax=Calocera viscosa (strain TUFC12733) TaxID=1330018 RepID=A0A167LZ41_CALVF|nr:hypothetical protein CALVIDRAFT_537375 [Calocera viscosa TUFC12733]
MSSGQSSLCAQRGRATLSQLPPSYAVGARRRGLLAHRTHRPQLSSHDARAPHPRPHSAHIRGHAQQRAVQRPRAPLARAIHAPLPALGLLPLTPRQPQLPPLRPTYTSLPRPPSNPPSPSDPIRYALAHDRELAALQAVHSPREVSPLRCCPAAAAAGAAEQRGSSLLHLAEPITGDSPRSRTRSEPAHPRSESSARLDYAPESALSDEEGPLALAAAARIHAPRERRRPPPAAVLPVTDGSGPPPCPVLPATYRPLDPPPDCFSTPGPWR